MGTHVRACIAVACVSYVYISSVRLRDGQKATARINAGLYYIQNEIRGGLNPERMTRPYARASYEKEVADDEADFH